MENRMKIDISIGSIIKVILLLLGLWFFYAVHDILILFFIVLVFVAAMVPLVDKMNKYVPRLLAVIFLAIFFLGILTAVGFLFVPILIDQIGQLASNLPAISAKLGPIYNYVQNLIPGAQGNLLDYSSQISNITSGVYSTTLGFLAGIVALIAVIVMSFYMLMEQDAIKSFVRGMVPENNRETVARVLSKISDKMGGWFRGYILLMLAIGLCDFIALSIIGVPYALALGMWGGLTEAIPYIGPWLGVIPAIIIAFTISPVKALIVLLVYLLIQQLESSFLVPKIMGKAVGLSPVLIILALLIGGKLMGLLGVIIAVPVAAALSVIFQERHELKKIRL